jgi:hypothetical protein
MQSLIPINACWSTRADIEGYSRSARSRLRANIQRRVMIIFRISAEPDGWYVCTDAARSGPCLSRALAIERAEGMAEAIRAHGESAAVDVGEDGIAVIDEHRTARSASAF